MKRIAVVLTGLILFTIAGCSRKTHPTATTTTTDTKPAAPVVKPVKRAIPKVIVVNDRAAKKHISGRYYYDLEGHRYWRNNRDGKYYLFHKSMFDNPDFKATGN